MNTKYKDKYYDHFSQKEFKQAPDFCQDKNYMMRFIAPLNSYTFDNNNLTIIFFKEGSGEIIWNGKRVKVGKNKFIVLNPGVGWEYINERQEYIDVFSIVISDEFRKQLNFYNKSTESQLLESPFEQINENSFFIESPLNANCYKSGELLKKIHTQSERFEFKFLAPEELAIEVLKQISKEQIKAYSLASKIDVKKKATQLETFKRLLIANEYIHDNITNPISLQELSIQASLSKHHLYESFKTIYGKTPHQYINRLKVTKSKEYLKKGQLSISEVSDLFGFSDLSVFSKVFKKAYGHPPSYYQT
ncbi:AraC family transcriptional regulator [Flavivirga amylovorans]|uniref:AraC family transcriptional regulator n=1 Tax=Flavivirga amylovorans TaxID=870486 RepID=A0ABT8WYG5_9FLAO|nr:helix-turn-helix domain-containing protein [Flavivirga amylovorans]MDO5986720.1 AraC family transcriptional regulator [Flavivirga amylovorans]